MKPLAYGRPLPGETFEQYAMRALEEIERFSYDLELQLPDVDLRSGQILRADGWAGLSFSHTVKSPTNAEDRFLFYTPVALTVSQFVGVLVGSGGPSLTVVIRHGTDRNAAGTALITGGTAFTNTTVGQVVTSFNNAAIAARHAQNQYGAERVAVIDFDVHHGNGTEEIFAGDDKVLMVSTFQHPFYPYSGTENPAANMCNVPVKAGTRGEGFRDVVTDVWLPRLRDFAPEFIYISAGFDAHYEDDMASLGLVESDYAWVTEQLKGVAAQTARGRIVSMLEGGYSLSALARSVAAHIKVLAEL